MKTKKTYQPKYSVELEILKRYVQLKREITPLLAQVFAIKGLFTGSCNLLAHGADQIQLPGALIFKKLQNTWKYPARIANAEKKLEKMKARHEKKHNPDKVEIVWSVKLS